LPFGRIEIPGAAFFASIAYSVYLSHKLVIQQAIQFCSSHNIALTAVPAFLLVEISIYTVGVILFLAVERPFLQLRRRVAPPTSHSFRARA
jgi:peptidoglycan/LPS O-acetylase OafA/YrhL